MLTVSNALLMSKAINTVLVGGFSSLNPRVMTLLIVCSAVVVEWFVLNPCWCSIFSMLFVMCGRMIFSSTLAMGDKRDIGLYDSPI